MTCDIWYIDEGFLVWIILSTYISYEAINWVCTAGFAVFAFIGFYFRFLTLLLFMSIIIYVYILAYHLYFIPPVSSSYQLYHACFLLDITYYLSICSCMPVLTTRFLIHPLSIQIYRYTCAYPCTPLGIHQITRWRVSDSSRSSCPNFRA